MTSKREDSFSFRGKSKDELVAMSVEEITGLTRSNKPVSNKKLLEVICRQLSWQTQLLKAARKESNRALNGGKTDE